MAKPPPIDLLHSTHTFPTDYTFKVIGSVENAFVDRVVAAARQAAYDSTKLQHSTRHTEGGKHVAVTLSVHAPSAEAVLEIYHALAKLEGLVLLM